MTHDETGTGLLRSLVAHASDRLTTEQLNTMPPTIYRALLALADALDDERNGDAKPCRWEISTEGETFRCHVEGPHVVHEATMHTDCLVDVSWQRYERDNG